MAIKNEHKKILTVAKVMAYEAGKILKNGFNRKLKISYKGRIDPVTEYDLKSEKLLTSRIRKQFPDHAILAEETASAAGSIEKISEAEYRWIIDPLDGTVNYSHGFPMYAVSIGIEQAGELVAGVVYDPERDEMFHAALGGGAWLNRKRIKVTSEKKLERSLLATGFGYDIATARKNNLGLFCRMAKKAQAVRRPGSAALDLCYLAAGRFDGFWELKLHPWDTAAALLILSEAGGCYTRINGAKYSIYGTELLATNGAVHSAMQKVLLGRDR